MKLSQLAHIICKEQKLRRIAETGNKDVAPIYQFNFWDVSPDESWFARFMRHRGIEMNKRLSLYSVFGDRDVIRYDEREVKMFVTGENIHSREFHAYADNMLADKEIGLSMGFDYFEDDDRYIRFPLWLRTQFAPEMSEKDIVQRVRELRYPIIGERIKFATLISRYDWGGTRSAIYNELRHIDRIYCPSKVLHNDDGLVKEFNDDKNAYMRQFYFNICPENSNAYGYVTEKIFDAINAGCIPIYWGSYNEPEKNILNQDAIIFWDKNGSNERTIQRITDLYANKEKLQEFIRQPRMSETAEEWIVQVFDQLEKKIREVTR